MHGEFGLGERVDVNEPDAVTAGAPDSDKLARAQTEVQALQRFFIPSKLATMLLRRYSREIVQSVLPGVEVPDVPPPSSRAKPEVQNGRAPASRPTHISQLIPIIPRERNTASAAIEGHAETDRADPEECQFQFVPWIQCTFPHSDPGSATNYSRVNGGQSVTMSTTSPDYGLPYGVPARLLTIYIVSEIVKTESSEVFVGNSITDFMRRLGVTITTGKRGTVKAYREQLKRLALAVFTFREDIQAASRRKGLKFEKELFIRGGIIWDSPGEPVGWGSTLLISETFKDAILDDRAAPLRTEVLAKLRRSPMDLDLYAWLVNRLHRLKTPTVIKWAELALQVGQSYERECDFRHGFQQSLDRVKKVYPEAKAFPRPNGLLLLPSPHHIPPRRSTLSST